MPELGELRDAFTFEISFLRYLRNLRICNEWQQMTKGYTCDRAFRRILE
jgi:hypothetical protein